MTEKPTLVTVGLITKPHNLTGLVRVFPITDYPERFKDRRELLMEHKGRVELLEIEKVTFASNYLVVQFKGIDSIEKAEELRGAYLKVPETQLAPLNEDSYYIYQLIGLCVKDTHGTPVGKLTDVLQTGANDVYVVHSEAGTELLIPALKQVVKKIDLKAGIMTIEKTEAWDDAGDKDAN